MTPTPGTPGTPEREALVAAREALDEARTYCEGPQWSPSMANDCADVVRRIDRVLDASPAAGGVQALTDEQIDAITCEYWSAPGPLQRDVYREYARLIEAAMLAATPPAAPAQALTDEQIDDCLPLGMHAHSVLCGPDEIRRFARRIEARAAPPAAPAQGSDASHARRYRWLRDAALGEIVFDHTDSQREGGSRFVLHVPFDGHPINNDEESARALDAAIDAALVSQEGAAK